MNDLTQPLAAETEALAEAYAALNRNDVDGFVKDFHSDIVRIEFEGSPMAGTYRGFAAVREHVAQGRGTWAEGACEPDRFVVAGDKVVVLTTVHVRLKDRTDWIDGRTGDVFTFRNGKVIEFRTFGEPEQALAWAEAEDRS
jgi:ketosteroid isomerase-like protein